MIKRVVHIDQNFPRRLSEQATKTGPVNTNWGFDTHAATDDINGSIDMQHQGSGAISGSEITQSTYVDQSYDNTNNTNDRKIATQLQFNNLTEDEGQIRFNANVFNYIVHTEIDNIILKYDSPVIYAMENWKDKVLVVKGLEYPILFNILLHDPMGIDADAYEGWLGNKKFVVRNRKDDYNVSNTAPQDHINQQGSTGGIACGTGNIALGAQYDYKIAVEKLEDPYLVQDDDNHTSFRLKIHLGGQGYTADDINSTDDELDDWDEILKTDKPSEEDINEAWEKCSGVKFKFFDVAGNTTYWVMPYLDLQVVTIEELYKMKKLILEFINTVPADLFLGEDLIGKTTVKVTNPNSKLSSYPIVIGLDENSIGRLYPSTHKEYTVKDPYMQTKSKHANKDIARIATENVDNIDESGWVIAWAYVDLDNFVTEATAAIRIMVQNLLRATGSLGEWIKECRDNTRKITLEPFVPQYLKETTDKDPMYYRFVKFTERYLNTMYKAYDKNCYISILEMIARIGNFNDCTTIYKNLLDKYDDDHGDMLHIDANEINMLIDVERVEPTDEA